LQFIERGDKVRRLLGRRITAAGLVTPACLPALSTASTY
jgi:hypothetical protein